VEDLLAPGGECEARTLNRAQRTGSDRKRSFISASLASQFTRKARSETLPDWCQTLCCDASAFRSDTGQSIEALMVIERHTVHILCILGTRKSVHAMHSMCTEWNKLGGLRCTNGCVFRLPLESRTRSETVSERQIADGREKVAAPIPDSARSCDQEQFLRNEPIVFVSGPSSVGRCEVETSDEPSASKTTGRDHPTNEPALAADGEDGRNGEPTAFARDRNDEAGLAQNDNEKASKWIWDQVAKLAPIRADDLRKLNQERRIEERAAKAAVRRSRRHDRRIGQRARQKTLAANPSFDAETRFERPPPQPTDLSHRSRPVYAEVKSRCMKLALRAGGTSELLRNAFHQNSIKHNFSPAQSRPPRDLICVRLASLMIPSLREAITSEEH
jgi:hypothetical protein